MGDVSRHVSSCLIWHRFSAPAMPDTDSIRLTGKLALVGLLTDNLLASALDVTLTQHTTRNYTRNIRDCVLCAQTSNCNNKSSLFRLNMTLISVKFTFGTISFSWRKISLLTFSLFRACCPNFTNKPVFRLHSCLICQFPDFLACLLICTVKPFLLRLVIHFPNAKRLNFFLYLLSISLHLKTI